MSNSDEYSDAVAGPSFRPDSVGTADPRVPLLNLSTVGERMDSLHRFLWESVNSNTVISRDQMAMVSSEIVSAIHQIIVNGTALVACSQITSLNSSFGDVRVPVSVNRSDLGKSSNQFVDLKVEGLDEELKRDLLGFELDCEIVELDAMELLVDHVHLCEICGKGFKRDANLRMHMRAHGDQFKTPEALAKPDRVVGSERKSRFCCPFEGCTRNKMHKKFRPLKSVICVKNHFKRSHCPKMYSCNRCNKKSFSVVADLKSHLKHCGETKWRCSCGTSFSRKDKLFGHMALFEGHMPAVVADDAKAKVAVVAMEEDEDENWMSKEDELASNCSDNTFFEGLLDGFGSLESYCLQDVLGTPNSLDT